MRIVLLSSFITLLAASPVLRAETPELPAIAYRDCAPWDGAAFVVSIARAGKKTVNADSPWMQVSIWQAPRIDHPVTFSFPDNTGKVGAVLLERSAFPSVKGTVTFKRATMDQDLEGSFDLTTPKGEHLVGRFRAKWIEKRVICG